MKLLFLGGPLDGQLQETNEPLSPVLPTTIKVTLPTGIIVQYTVHFFAGTAVQFPLACFENLTPDDIFKMLLQWYVVKPFVQRVPTELPSPDAQEKCDVPEASDSLELPDVIPDVKGED
jgi:hypothetical protein